VCVSYLFISLFPAAKAQARTAAAASNKNNKNNNTASKPTTQQQRKQSNTSEREIHLVPIYETIIIDKRNEKRINRLSCLTYSIVAHLCVCVGLLFVALGVGA
jgi:hypothetical protein